MMTSKVFLVVAFSLFAFCLGKPECDQNQCKDLWTAKKCNKVKYCIAEEWSKLKPTGNTDNVCEICLKMVKEARDTLKSNETREELLEVFEGSCRLLVLKPAVKLCDDLVDQFVPELVEILSSQMDPETVCSVAKLCNNEVFAAALKNSKGCLYCESFTESLANQMESLSPEQFKNGMVNLCRTAGSFSDACYYISSIYSDSFYQNSKSILNKKPCEATSLCPSGPLHPKSIVKIKKKICPLCKNVMTSLKNQLLNVKSPEEFVENVFKICEKFNFPYNTCLKISSPTLYEKLKNYDTSNLLCRMTFCREKLDEVGSFWPLIPSDDESFSLTRELDPLELLENFEMFFPEIKQEKAEIRATTEAIRPTISYGDPIDNPVFLAPVLGVPTFKDCHTCSHVLGVLESAGYKKENSEDTLNNVCDKADNVGLCKEFVNNFSHILTKAYSEGFVSKKMCEDLVPSCVIKRDDDENPEAASDSTCNLCLNSMKLLKHIDPEFWNEVEEKCTNLPETSRNLCTFVFSNLPSIFKNYHESEICNSMRLCGPSAIKLENISRVQVAIKVDESEFCNTCISTLHKIIEVTKKNNSAMIVRIILESACFILPPEERRMCAHMIEVIGVEKILKMIESIHPAEMCAEIHLCGSSRGTVTEPLSSGTSVETEEKIPCKFCLMAIRTLLDQLQDDKTEDAIRKALDGLCNYFPEETRDTCRNLIDEYTEDIIDMIIADFNATEICMYLKICPHHKLSVISIAAQSSESSNRNDYVVFDIQTNQVLDWNEKPTLESHTEKVLEKPTQMDLEKFHEYVKECALCEALVGVINSHSKMLSKDYDFSANAEYICSIVPKNDKKKCKSLLISYGPSIVNLLVDKKTDINEVCVYIDLCDPKMQAKVNQPVSVPESKFIPEENECAKGPRFWCANAENAEKCGTFLHCQETVWKNWENPPRRLGAH